MSDSLTEPIVDVVVLAGEARYAPHLDGPDSELLLGGKVAIGAATFLCENEAVPPMLALCRLRINGL